MYCQKCGAQNPDSSTFCGKCGQRLVAAMDIEESEPKIIPITLDLIRERLNLPSATQAQSDMFELLAQRGG